ncbi:MAG: hypothetical protein HYV60_16955 [Planctomycetia bacterium]|nr:hypothetical protein [Planctomycetia bacterium]
MSIQSLLPLAGAAIAPVLERVIGGVTGGVSFLDVLQTQESGAEAVEATASNTLQQDFAELTDRLRERFSQLGIDLKTPLRLKQDGHDRVVVDGEHPDRVLIESIFGTDEELTKLFNAVAASATAGNGSSVSGIAKEFRFVLGHTEALIEFA